MIGQNQSVAISELSVGHNASWLQNNRLRDAVNEALTKRNRPKRCLANNRASVLRAEDFADVDGVNRRLRSGDDSRDFGERNRRKSDECREGFSEE